MDSSGKEIAFDLGLMIAIWLVGILFVTSFSYGIGGYGVPQWVQDMSTHFGTSPHAFAQFGYMLVVIVGLIVFFAMTIKRRGL